MNHNLFGLMHTPYRRRDFLKQLSAFTLTTGFSGSMLSGCGGVAVDDASGLILPSGEPIAIPFDSSIPWWLQGNFAPVANETEAFDLPVQGAIPDTLNGLYVRNGSNPQAADSSHWFFGDGMLHGVRLENGKAVSYRNRYIQTDKYLDGDSGGPPTGGNNSSNVSAIYHGGKLLTSGEIGLPFEINVSDLSTVGVTNFDNSIQTSFTAHPKIHPATGNLHFFGYWFAEPYLTYHVADPTGKVIHTQPIPVGKPTMVHSFAITEQDVVFWECPVVFDLAAAAAGADNPFQWQPEYGARVGIMPLGGMASEIRWKEIDPCFVFHEVNAFRQGDDVVVDLCKYSTMFQGGASLGGSGESSLSRWTIGTGGDELSFSEQIITRASLELPAHDRRFSGRKNQHGWLLEMRDDPNTVDFAGITHVEMDSGNISTWDPGLNNHANEPFFVPDGEGEGEGWLLTYVFNHSSNKSYLAILNALDVASGPVASVELPQRVPFGFHGVWVPNS
ncbi:MAG: carotenoid oxygenase family protein [Deltaproteobacteria bacterium]|jgi:carotenoid cleavage dioxygenase-like enzyme|nr:carotenoid oxygenase family protein [Deltaproteobacteria bacterium]MBT6433719.1 carotenoid oxygenase family protein [Deltaproteobacteria bacterium]